MATIGAERQERQVDINWSSVFTPELNPYMSHALAYRHEPENSVRHPAKGYLELADWEASLFYDLIMDDDELSRLFAGLSSDLVVEAIRSHEFYHRIGNQDPYFLDSLLYNKTAHIIASRKTIPSYIGAEPTDEQISEALDDPAFLLSGKLEIVDKIIENVPKKNLPSVLFDNTADFVWEITEVLAQMYGIGGINPKTRRIARQLSEYDRGHGRFIVSAHGLPESQGEVSAFLQAREGRAKDECRHIGRFAAFATFLKTV